MVAEPGIAGSREELTRKEAAQRAIYALCRALRDMDIQVEPNHSAGTQGCAAMSKGSTRVYHLTCRSYHVPLHTLLSAIAQVRPPHSPNPNPNPNGGTTLTLTMVSACWHDGLLPHPNTSVAIAAPWQMNLHGMPFVQGQHGLTNNAARVHVSGLNHKFPVQSLEEKREWGAQMSLVSHINGGPTAIRNFASYQVEVDMRMEVEARGGKPYGALALASHGDPRCDEGVCDAPALVQRQEFLHACQCSPFETCGSCGECPSVGGETTTEEGNVGTRRTAMADGVARHPGAGKARNRQKGPAHLYPTGYTSYQRCGCVSWVGGVRLFRQKCPRCHRCQEPTSSDLSADLFSGEAMAELAYQTLLPLLQQDPLFAEGDYMSVNEEAFNGLGRQITVCKVYNLQFKKPQGRGVVAAAPQHVRYESNQKATRLLAKDLILQGTAAGIRDVKGAFELLSMLEADLQVTEVTGRAGFDDEVREAIADMAASRMAIELTLKLGDRAALTMAMVQGVQGKPEALNLPFVEIDRRPTLCKALTELALLVQPCNNTSTLGRVFDKYRCALEVQP